jgi:hypothetical protein
MLALTPQKPKPLEIAYSMGIEVADVTMRRPSAAGSGVPEVQASPRFRRLEVQAWRHDLGWQGHDREDLKFVSWMLTGNTLGIAA